MFSQVLLVFWLRNPVSPSVAKRNVSLVAPVFAFETKVGIDGEYQPVEPPVARSMLKITKMREELTVWTEGSSPSRQEGCGLGAGKRGIPLHIRPVE